MSSYTQISYTTSLTVALVFFAANLRFTEDGMEYEGRSRGSSVLVISVLQEPRYEFPSKPATSSSFLLILRQVLISAKPESRLGELEICEISL